MQYLMTLCYCYYYYSAAVLVKMSETAIDSFMKKTTTTMLDLVCPVNHDMRSFFKLNQIPIPRYCCTSTNLDVKKPAPDTPKQKDILVARYGKIYKRKAPSAYLGLQFKCTSTTRYCKLCDSQKPLDAFYTAVKRFVCRRCHYLRVKSYRYARYKENDFEMRSENIWDNCLADRMWFGYAKLNFDLPSIKDIIVGAKIPWELCPRACPIDPSLPMRPRNVAILSCTAYRLLLEVWKHTCSRGAYIGLVQRSNMVPRNFDVAFPCTPFHNPDYLRPIIDVGPILLEEQNNPVSAIETTDHSFMQHLREIIVEIPTPAPPAGI